MDETEEHELPLHEEVARRLDLITETPGAVLKYDADGDGMLNAAEWEMLRALVEAQVARERTGEEEIEDPWTVEEETEDPHVDLPVLEVIDKRYEILREIGRGTQGKTLLARRRADNHYVAVKELSFQNLENWKSLELFEREAQVLNELDHPRIPSFVDSFNIEVEGDSNRFFLVQSFVSGTSLDVLLARRDRVGEKQVLQFARDVLEVLAYLHTRNPPIIHRDVKPSNLIRQPDGRYCLVDFGGAQVVLPSDIGGSTIIGTTGYMPPEQLTGRAVPESDLYALGATLIHLVTHVSPSDLPTRRLKLDWRERAGLTAPLGDFIDELVQPVVEDRPGSAEEAIRRVDILSGDTSALVVVPAGATNRSIEDVKRRKADFLSARKSAFAGRRKRRLEGAAVYDLSERADSMFGAGLIVGTIGLILAATSLPPVVAVAVIGVGAALLGLSTRRKRQRLKLMGNRRFELLDIDTSTPTRDALVDVRADHDAVVLVGTTGEHRVANHLSPKVRTWLVQDLRVELGAIDDEGR